MLSSGERRSHHLNTDYVACGAITTPPMTANKAKNEEDGTSLVPYELGPPTINFTVPNQGTSPPATPTTHASLTGPTMPETPCTPADPLVA